MNHARLARLLRGCVRGVTLFLVAAWLAGCATATFRDIEVTARQVPGFDPGNYRSYAWLETAGIINDPLGQWEPPDFDADILVASLVDRELEKKGLARTESTPELVVTFVSGIDMASLELREDPDNRQQTTLQNIPRGALVVVLADAATRERLWVGVAMADVARQPEDDAMRRRLEYAVTEMFRQLPVDNQP